MGIKIVQTLLGFILGYAVAHAFIKGDVPTGWVMVAGIVLYVIWGVESDIRDDKLKGRN